MLMDDDFEMIFDVINKASKNCLSWELRKREMEKETNKKNVVATRQSENPKKYKLQNLKKYEKFSAV
jgi:hypothetical protein